MSTLIATKDTGAIHSIDKGDVTIKLLKVASIVGSPDSSAAGADSTTIGIAKNFTFNVSKPKTPIYVLSQRTAAGFARDPEDRTFTMNELACFERIITISEFTQYSSNYVVQIVVNDESTDAGLASGSKQTIIHLDGIVFETVNYTVDANTAEYTFDFTGKFREGFITGTDIVGSNPV